MPGTHFGLSFSSTSNSGNHCVNSYTSNKFINAFVKSENTEMNNTGPQMARANLPRYSSFGFVPLPIPSLANQKERILAFIDIKVKNLFFQKLLMVLTLHLLLIGLPVLISVIFSSKISDDFKYNNITLISLYCSYLTIYVALLFARDIIKRFPWDVVSFLVLSSVQALAFSYSSLYFDTFVILITISALIFVSITAIVLIYFRNDVSTKVMNITFIIGSLLFPLLWLTFLYKSPMHVVYAEIATLLLVLYGLHQAKRLKKNPNKYTDTQHVYATLRLYLEPGFIFCAPICNSH